MIETDAGVEGLAKTPDPSIMLFANRRDNNKGIGRIKITSNDPNSFATTVSYTPLRLGRENDYFDVNEAFSIVVTQDARYAFVAGRNGRLFGSGIPSIDSPKAGSNVGIISNPLTDDARLIAATRPIPNAIASDLTLSGNDNYLFASYPGVGSVMVWDVEEIIETIDDPTPFKIDHLGRGEHSPIFNFLTQRDASTESLGIVPIDNINPDITIASDLQLVKESYIFNEFEFGVPEDSNRAPLTVGFNPWSVTSTYRDCLDLLPVDDDNVTTDLTPTFEWEFDEGFEDVEEVNLFVSSFSLGKGLLPWDELVDLSDPDFLSSLSEEQKKEFLTRPWQEYNDFNPGRILTATWKKETNTWYWHDGTTIIPHSDGAPENNQNRFTLPISRSLTPGQDYHWAVEAVGAQKTNIDFGSFESIAPPSTNPFSSVSILTHGFTLIPGSTGIDSGTYEMAGAITDAQGKDADQKGLILRYDKPTGLWIPVDEEQNVLDDVMGGLDTSDPDYLSTLATNIKTNYQNKPLVLIPEWSKGYESVLPISGFTEGAADAIFASMVQLDQALGGEIGISDPVTGELTQLYNDEGDLIRTHGDIFNSPLHFIGFSRGTVVNSEIIQRLGTYYPHAGGAIDADGNPAVDADGNPVRDLQMTTIDPHDFQQNSLNVGLPLPGLGTILDFRDFNEPEVTVWDNITFADNYYQNIANPSGGTWTPNGREIEFADLNVPLNGRSGFIKDNGLGAPHTGVFAWYAGTVDLALDEVVTGYQITGSGIPSELRANKIYDRLGSKALENLALNNLGEEDISQLLDLSATNPALTGWYLKDDEDNSEGIGEGWSYSILGGGERPDVTLGGRTSVSEDNTDVDGTPGDFAVPTVFNGNFDYQLSNTPEGTISDNTPVPGWSFHNGEDTEPLLYKHLVDIDDTSIIDGVASFGASLSAVSDESSDLIRDKAVILNKDFQKLVHNGIHLPEWGDLRFDLAAPIKEGKLKVTLKAAKIKNTSIGKIFEPVSFTQIIDLDLDANGSLSQYENDIYKIGAGRNGYETFHINSKELEKFRGLKTKLSFELIGTTAEVELNNIFFKSKHLQFGNPTEARYSSQPPNLQNKYKTNLLIEKPQYTVSYGSDINTPVWVSWQLNDKWLGDVTRPPGKTRFDPDPQIPGSYKSVGTSDFQDADGNGFGFDQGHIIPSGDRTNTQKDNRATFIGTNLIPQSVDNNQFFGDSDNPAQVSAWLNIEKFERELVKQGKELYITAGVFRGNATPQIISNAKNITSNTNSNAFQSNGINIPKWTWKTILVLDEPNQKPSKIKDDTVTYTFLTPNIPEPYANWASSGLPASHPFNEIQSELELSTSLSDIANSTEWRNPKTWQITVNQLENLLTGWGGRKYDFLSNVPKTTQNTVEDNIYYYYPDIPPSS